MLRRKLLPTFSGRMDKQNLLSPVRFLLVAYLVYSSGLNTEALLPPESLVNFYRTTQSHVQEYSTLQRIIIHLKLMLYKYLDVIKH
jgi:hypothetical protein